MRVCSLGVAFLCAVVAGACSAQPAAQVPERSVAPPAADDGIVKIQKGSEPYIGVETVSAAKSASMLGAPAHVEFKDGAVSQLGAPLDGRVLAVHAKVGDHVKRGDPLVTLDCPDAAEIRAQV